MKQATQLEFDFMSDLTSVQPSVVKNADRLRFLSFDDAELSALKALRQAAVKAKALAPILLLCVQGVACVAFCFSLMFLAAIFGA